MTPVEQVAQIVKMLNPENPNTTDAVFLVQNYINKMNAVVTAKDKQIALLEARLEDERKLTDLITNEKLAKESELKNEIAKEKARGGMVQPGGEEKGKPAKGTL